MSGTQDYSRSQILKTLRNVDIFRNVPQDMLDGIAGNMLVASYSEGENIITKGEEGDSMFVILEGRVKVHDDDFMVMTLAQNDFFGEIALLSRMKRISSVTAFTNCTVGVINRPDFYNVLKQFPEVTTDIMNALCMRILKQNETLINFLKNRENELMRLVEERTEELQEAQRQQFLQEKMASLGQLSSGIAHEIKNPLNFVNNFSILTREMAQELAEEKSLPERKALLDSISQNLDRIIEHGKRADNILNKLTQISDHGTGPYTNTDVNTLCSEIVTKTYARFVRDFSWFTCGITMVFSKELPLVSLSREDLGRAMSFLLINAFESMEERVRHSDGTGYRPELVIETETEGDQLRILIMDNGLGIREENIGQIFLPFFTTKPSRRNTGVGLTLADNTIRGMKGRIDVTPAWDNGARFVITLPV